MIRPERSSRSAATRISPSATSRIRATEVLTVLRPLPMSCNTPTASYAAHIPPFGLNNGEFAGGQFLDGRVDTLEEQAQAPFLNPLEMNMANETLVRSISDQNKKNISLKKVRIEGEEFYRISNHDSMPPFLEMKKMSY